MKDHVNSIYRTIVLISILYLVAFLPTFETKKKKKPKVLDPKEVFTLTKTLVRVGDFLAQHKFFEKDRRNPKSDDLPLTFMERFPDPPFLDIPKMIRMKCDRGVRPCLDLIYDLSYKRLTRTDLFTLRVSASYYLCWYTMHEEPELRHFGSACQVSYSGKHDKTNDFRGWDKMPFDCALHCFCPDPCCGSYEPTIDTNRTGWQNVETPKGFVWQKALCAQTKGYPCGITELACSLDFKKNRNWNDLLKNKLNVSCSCGKIGKNFEWNDRIKMCVDQDECRNGNFQCENNSICRNIANDYYCTCRLGYMFSAKRQKCIRDTNFQMDDVLRVQAGQYFGMTPPPKAATAEFQWATYFYWLIDHAGESAADRSHCFYCVALWTLALGVSFYQGFVYN